MTVVRSKMNGRGVDAAGGPVIDPTPNVSDLVRASDRHHDDMRVAQDRLHSEQSARISEVSKLRSDQTDATAVLRASHAAELSAKTAAHLEAVRQIDQVNNANTNRQADAAVKALADQTSTLATTVQVSGTETAAKLAAQLSAVVSDINTKIGELQKTANLTTGKESVADPVQAQLLIDMKALLLQGARGGGQIAGMNDFWKVLIAIAMAFFAWSAWQRQVPDPVLPQYFYTPKQVPR